MVVHFVLSGNNMIRRDNLFLSLFSTAAIVSPAYAVDYLTIAQAQTVLFPDADAFTAHELTLTPDQRKQINKISGVIRRREDHQRVWKAARGETVQGWLIIDDVVGKHDDITYATALSPDGRVLGVEIMSYREIYGGEVRDANWRQNFVGKTLADPLKLDQDIPNISGATLSSRNVMRGVKRLLALQQVALPHA